MVTTLRRWLFSFDIARCELWARSRVDISANALIYWRAVQPWRGREWGGDAKLGWGLGNSLNILLLAIFAGCVVFEEGDGVILSVQECDKVALAGSRLVGTGA